jgi:hypothetical protein
VANSWADQAIKINVPAAATTGPVVVTVNGNPSNAFSFIVILSHLPDTGITKCYNNTSEITCPSPGQPFYGQDAQYTTNPMSFTDNGDGTVTDNVTGLVWQKQDDNVTRNWADAGAYCDGLTLAGHTDWRLPNEYELQGIVNYSRYNPSIDPTYFPGTKSAGYWSSSTYADGSYDAWFVGFDDGFVGSSYKAYTGYVRCVR